MMIYLFNNLEKFVRILHKCSQQIIEGYEFMFASSPAVSNSEV